MFLVADCGIVLGEADLMVAESLQSKEEKKSKKEKDFFPSRER